MSRETQHTSVIGLQEFDPVLCQTWQRLRGSLSLILVGACTSVFFTTAMLGVAGLCDRQQIISFLGLSYLGVSQRYSLHWVAI